VCPVTAYTGHGFRTQNAQISIWAFEDKSVTGVPALLEDRNEFPELLGWKLLLGQRK